MPSWEVQRNNTTVEPDLYDIRVVETANPFGDYAIAKIDDADGAKFDQYTRGTRLDFSVIENSPGTLRIPAGTTQTIADGIIEQYETVQAEGVLRVGGEELEVASGNTTSIASGETRTVHRVEAEGTLQVEGTLKATPEGVLQAGDSGTNELFTGYAVESRELDQQGADALEVEAYSFDQFLRRDTVTNDQTGNTITEALEDIIKTDTPITWNAANVDVTDDQELTQSLQGERVENAIQALRGLSSGEDFGVNASLEFYFRPFENAVVSRGIDDTQWFDYDIPEEGKQTLNEVTVFYDGGNKSVTIDDGSDKLKLQDSLGTDDPVTLSEEVVREDITDIYDARKVGESILEGRSTTLTGTVTTFGLYDASPGDVISITIKERGIDDDFRIAAIEYRWGRGETVLTIVEKRGDQDDLLVRISDSVKRIEKRNADEDATGNRVTSTTAAAEITGGGDVAGNSYTTFRYTNEGRNQLRNGWIGNGNITVAEIAVGTGTSKPTRTDSSLGNQTETAAVAETLPDSTTASYTADVTTTDISEVGLLDGSGNLLARATVDASGLDSPVTVTVDLTVSNDADVSRGVVTDAGQTAIRDIIADNTPALPTQYAYGSDGTDPTTTDTALGNQQTVVALDEILSQSFDTQTEWSDALSPSAADEWQVTSGRVENYKSCFTTEAENADTESGTDNLDQDRFSNGRAIGFSETGDVATFDFTLGYDIEAGDFEIALRGEDTTSNAADLPTIEVFLDGTSLGTYTGIDLGTTSVAWETELIDGEGLTDPGTVSAGDHTLKFECSVGDTGTHYIDVVAPYDETFTYTFDNTTTGTGTGATLTGPELYPDQTLVTFPAATTRREFTTVRADQEWLNDEVGGSQKIELSPDNATWTTTNNSENATATFASAAREAYTRVGISRFASGQTTSTPTDGDTSQAVDIHDLYPEIQAIQPGDIGQAVTQAIVQPGTITGVTLREAGQLDASNNLLTHCTFAEFTVTANQNVISNETLTFRNPQ